MYIDDIDSNNWRNDPGIKSTIIYGKKFALIPTKCHCGASVWLKNYYVKYVYWGTRVLDPNDKNFDKFDMHIDTLEKITEAEYLVRKLTEGF